MELKTQTETILSAAVGIAVTLLVIFAIVWAAGKGWKFGMK